jgi:ribose transport system permease protein
MAVVARTHVDRKPAVVASWLRSSSILISLLVLILILYATGSILTDRFATVANILNVLRAIVVPSLISLGQTVVVLTGGIDLSVGACISVAGVLTATLAGDNPARLAWVVPLVLAVSGGIGLVNGLIVTRLRVHSIVATLGVAAILQGTALLYAPRPTVGPVELEDMAFGTIGGLPTGSVIAVLLVLVVALLLRSTRTGRKIYAVGGNQRAASLLGLPVDNIICLAFVFSGLCSGLAGIYMVGLLGSGSATMGQGYELTSIAPVVLGGTQLAGGVGGVVGTLIAVFLLGLLNNLLNFLQVSTFYQWVVQGVVILLAVSIFSRRRS